MDLRTTYMGLPLKHPIVASASPLSEKLDNIKRMEDAGAAAVVMFSLFEEQIKRENAAIEHLITAGTESFAESLSYFPDYEVYETGPEEYLKLLQAAEAVDIRSSAASTASPTKAGGHGAHDAGGHASGIELNIYYIPANLYMTGRGGAALPGCAQGGEGLGIHPGRPEAEPFFSAMGNMARQFDEAGADALVLFNRFYQPDLDLDKLNVKANLELSTPSEIRLPLLWIAVLFGRINASLAATRGVHSHIEVIKYLMAGADAVMTTSSMLRHGIGFLTTLVDGLRTWMEERQYESVRQMKGSMSQEKCSDPTAFERAQYMRTLKSFRDDKSFFGTRADEFWEV
jgi:dihydroorotate dehydrogenase (fumarate)